MAHFFTFTPKKKAATDIDFIHLIESTGMKILVATEKPFAKEAVDGIRRIVEDAGYELALLEKYTDKAQLLAAVADVDALIVRSDKVTAEVIGAAKNLKIVVRARCGLRQRGSRGRHGARYRGDEYPGAELQRRGRAGARHDGLHVAQPALRPVRVRRYRARPSASTPTAMWANSWGARARRWA